MATSKLLATGLHVQPILDTIKGNPEMWAEITARQDHPGGTHRDTECIFVRGPEAFTIRKYFYDTGSFDYPAFDKLRPVLAPVLGPILTDLLRVERLGRVLIVNLRAGGIVPEHRDVGAYADAYARFHIILSTNPGCVSTTGGKAEHWEQGECWWFDHKALHAAVNLGETDRIHIIFDAVAPDFPVQRG